MKACLLEDESGTDVADVRLGPEPATLSVYTEYVDDHARRGIRSFLRLHDEEDRSVLRSRGRTLFRRVEPGRYRLIRYERHCRRSCRSLGPTAVRCSRRIRLPPRRTGTAVVVVDYARQRCHINVAPVEAHVEAQTSIRRTIRLAVRSAVVDGDFARACRFGTRAGRRRLLAGYNSSSGPDFPSCPAILRNQVSEYTYVVRRLRRSIVISNVRVRGRTARARVADGHGRFAGSGDVSLRRLQGRWRIDNSDLIPYGD